MVSEKRSIPCRMLLCLLVCLLLFYSCVVPAYASAVLYEVLAASARSMIASVIRACGVYVADGLADEFSTAVSNFEALTDSALSYVWERLPDYLKVVNTAGTLMLKMICRNGVYYVPRTIVEDVCTWLRQEIFSSEKIDYAAMYGFLPSSSDDLNSFNDLFKGINARYEDTSPYIDPSAFQYCYFIHLTPIESDSVNYWLSPILFFVNDSSRIKIKQSGEQVQVKVFANTSYSLIYQQYTAATYGLSYDAATFCHDFAITYSFPSSASDYYLIERQSGAIEVPDSSMDGLSLEDDAGTIASTWDSKSITVTDDKLGDSAVTGLPVSVYPPSTAATVPKADVTAGTVVDAETSTVEDETLGDATTENGFWSSVLSWLDRILTEIKALIGGITTPIVHSLSQVVAAVKAAAVAITDTLTLKFGTVDSYKLDLTSFFPFCIPFDLYDMLAAFVSEPEAPVFTFATGFLGNVYTVDIDLSPWNSVAKTVRAIQLCICIVGLAFATRKFIKW